MRARPNSYLFSASPHWSRSFLCLVLGVNNHPGSLSVRSQLVGQLDTRLSTFHTFFSPGELSVCTAVLHIYTSATSPQHTHPPTPHTSSFHASTDAHNYTSYSSHPHFIFHYPFFLYASSYVSVFMLPSSNSTLSSNSSSCIVNSITYKFLPYYSEMVYLTLSCSLLYLCLSNLHHQSL